MILVQVQHLPEGSGYNCTRPCTLEIMSDPSLQVGSIYVFWQIPLVLLVPLTVRSKANLFFLFSFWTPLPNETGPSSLGWLVDFIPPRGNMLTLENVPGGAVKALLVQTKKKGKRTKTECPNKKKPTKKSEEKKRSVMWPSIHPFIHPHPHAQTVRRYVLPSLVSPLLFLPLFCYGRPPTR